MSKKTHSVGCWPGKNHNRSFVCSVKRNAVRDSNSRFHGNNPRIFNNERKPTLQRTPSKIKESFVVNCNHIYLFSIFHFSVPRICKKVRVHKAKSYERVMGIVFPDIAD